MLPAGWDQELLGIAREHATRRSLRPTSVTSREDRTDVELPVLTVGGRVLDAMCPWLARLYETTFRDLAQPLFPEPLAVARDVRIRMNLNVQRGTEMRYECHVDSNPVEGLLYVTGHPPGGGGELVVSNREDARGVREIDADASVVYPTSGQLVFFDARRNPHYVRPLRREDAERVVVAMNFYTPSQPEESRPADLNMHLFGEP
jgi:hypothetical protein